MPEPILERLSRFSPDGSGLDRDALLFAAGRVSAGRRRGWAIAAGTLSVSQLVTLALLWSRGLAPAVPPHQAVSVPAAAKSAVAESMPSPRDTEEWVLVRRQLLASKNDDLPPPAPVTDLVPGGQPLRANAVSGFLGSN
jgi:hypothetical protein